MEGARAVKSALVAGDVREIVVLDGAFDEMEIETPSISPVQLTVVDEAAFGRFSDVQNSQGILAVVRMGLRSQERLLDLDRILAVDGVQDPGNLGTLIRTAAWFGIDGVVAGPGTVDFFNPKTVRSAMGGLFDVHLAESEDLASFLDDAARKGFGRFGADLDGESSETWRPPGPTVLVVGNEGSGLSAQVQQRLDGRVTIGGRGGRGGRGVESLNVAQAAGILMYEWTRRASE